MKKVSIIVPVYNVEEYLEKCLDSILNQTLKEIEVIVVNDGSPDNSQKIIDRYVKKDKRIIAIKKENGGQASARNMGIKIATGDYLLFVDSDDWIELDMLEKLYNTAISTGSDLVHCNSYLVKDGQKEESSTVYLDVNDEVKNYIFSQPGPCNKLFKRELWTDNDLKFSEGIIYEDYAVIPVFALYAKKITLINECLYNYLIRAGSSMNQMKFNPKLRDILYASDALMDNLNKAEKKYEEEFEYAIFMNAVRGPYFRLRYFKEGKPLIIEMIDWYKKNFPNWKKNKYLKKDKIKFKVYNYLITRKQFWLLNILKRR